MVDVKLACYISIGGELRFVLLLIMPSGLRRLIFDAHHTGGAGGHFKINKTLTVLRLHFLWICMRKEIITWVKGYIDCIRLQHSTQASRQLVHYQQTFGVLARLQATQEQSKFPIVCATCVKP